MTIHQVVLLPVQSKPPSLSSTCRQWNRVREQPRTKHVEGDRCSFHEFSTKKCTTQGSREKTEKDHPRFNAKYASVCERSERLMEWGSLVRNIRVKPGQDQQRNRQDSVRDNDRSETVHKTYQTFWNEKLLL